MGHFYYTKAALLDEADLEVEGWPQAEDLEALWEDAADAMSGHVYGEEVEYEPLALVSERFNAVLDMSGHYRASLVKENWDVSLKKIARTFAELDDNMMDPFLKTGDLKALEERMQTGILNRVKAGEYGEARSLITGIENLQDAELPGFRDKIHLSLGGDDDAYDMREKNYGSGRRLILEYAVVWP
ncbi:DUF1387 domain-containing protein [Celeribacter sp. PS-C1]|uniref:DUF1387 domain-containing protein n=1 Tax=Celeribacter sp. PS-C1 TaxID=2820813 RepID=UPI001CA4826F|nr:DUF1387 domain-containing protein [Celeribacter sp. PS-C1]MBW6419649.1 DUF1387 domain-containing protein [Celeribacter sp. PS-C1]